MPNHLLNSTSPYLLQHAHNPVDWHAWNDETLQKARMEDKMLLISIGYSACHWCHVMERESFEDKGVAEIMNRNFVCIKVDREERPDVDQVYMHAVQMVTGSGGWPLNCFALPDGRPFFGGTYFRKEQWKNLLENIQVLFETRRNDMEQQAESIVEGMSEDNLHIDIEDTGEFNLADLIHTVESLSGQFDMKEGGMAGAPKFPMPALLNFLLDYYLFKKDETVADFLRLTLKKMAFGGIYDQVGGGFARYSTDPQWKVPHFEKMLYDNAQLVSVYSRAYSVFKEMLYKETVEETLGFIDREMTSAEGGFYTALDADSEGEEGKYYTWKESEIKEILGKQAEVVMKYYNVGGKGLWEGGKNILMRMETADEFDTLQGFKPLHRFTPLLKHARQKLLKARNHRVKPGLDNKILTSWNAMMTRGYIDAYLALGNPEYLSAATGEMEFLLPAVSRMDGGLYHQAGSVAPRINGFLDDYAFVIDALLALYQAGFEEKWLHKAQELADYTVKYLLDGESGLFNYTSHLDREIITRTKELQDNVIPSSNSVMARALRHIGIAFDREDLANLSTAMLKKVKPLIKRHPASFSNWASLWLEDGAEPTVIAACGPDFLAKIHTIRKSNVKGIYYFGSEKSSQLPYLQNRFIKGKTLIYYCTGKECKLPTENAEEVIRMLDS